MSRDEHGVTVLEDGEELHLGSIPRVEIPSKNRTVPYGHLLPSKGSSLFHQYTPRPIGRRATPEPAMARLNGGGRIWGWIVGESKSGKAWMIGRTRTPGGEKLPPRTLCVPWDLVQRLDPDEPWDEILCGESLESAREIRDGLVSLAIEISGPSRRSAWSSFFGGNSFTLQWNRVARYGLSAAHAPRGAASPASTRLDFEKPPSSPGTLDAPPRPEGLVSAERVGLYLCNGVPGMEPMLWSISTGDGDSLHVRAEPRASHVGNIDDMIEAMIKRFGGRSASGLCTSLIARMEKESGCKMVRPNYTKIIGPDAVARVAREMRE